MQAVLKSTILVALSILWLDSLALAQCNEATEQSYQRQIKSLKNSEKSARSALVAAERRLNKLLAKEDKAAQLLNQAIARGEGLIASNRARYEKRLARLKGIQAKNAWANGIINVAVHCALESNIRRCTSSVENALKKFINSATRITTLENNFIAQESGIWARIDAQVAAQRAKLARTQARVDDQVGRVYIAEQAYLVAQDRTLAKEREYQAACFGAAAAF